MKKNLIYTLAALVVISGAVSCAKETVDSRTDANLKQIHIVALKDDAAKTTMNEVGTKLLWEAGDKISVWDGTAWFTSTDIKISADGISAEFTVPVGSTTAESYIAVYPASDKLAAPQGDVLTLEIPAVQTLSGDRCIAANAALSVAKITTTPTDSKFDVTFKNAFSLVEVVFGADNLTKLSVFDAALVKDVCGKVSVDAATAAVSACEGAKSATLVADGTFAKDKSYYIAIAPATFSQGVCFATTNSTPAKNVKKVPGELTFGRNGGLKFASQLTEFNKWVPFTITEKDELINFNNYMPFFLSDETVAIGSDIDLEGEQSHNWVPKDFYAALDGNGYTISGFYSGQDGDTGFIKNLYGQLKNLTLEGDYATKPTPDTIQDLKVAPVICMLGNANVENVISEGEIYTAPVTSGDSSNIPRIFAAGIVAIVDASATGHIKDCKFSGTITNEEETSSAFMGGGMCAYVKGDITFNNCSNELSLFNNKGECSSADEGAGIQLAGMVAKLYAKATFINCKNDQSRLYNQTASSYVKLAGMVATATEKSDGTTFTGCSTQGNDNTTTAGDKYPIRNFSAMPTNLYAAGMVAYIAKTNAPVLTFDNCTNEQQVLVSFVNGKSVTSAMLGGIVGYCRSGAIIKNCANNAKIQTQGSVANLYMGGIIGRNNSAPATVTNCTSDQLIYSNSGAGTGQTAPKLTIGNVGGILGECSVDGTKIENCTVGKNKTTSGRVLCQVDVATNLYLGGIAGILKNKATLSGNTYNASEVKLSGKTEANNGARIGGIAGAVTGAATLSGNFNYGNVLISSTGCTNTQYVSGILGCNSTAAATVTGNTTTGEISSASTGATNKLSAVCGITSTLATVVKDNKVKGKVGGVTLTADNFQDYLTVGGNPSVSGNSFIE